MHKCIGDINITPSIILAMENGLTLKDARAGGYEKSKITSMSFAPFLWYQIQKNTEKFSILKVSITEGKNRELRRFFAHFERQVLDLKRVNFAGIELNNLPSGKTRYLERREYQDLRNFIKQLKKDDISK